MITTIVGAYPKPNYLKITDWLNSLGGTELLPKQNFIIKKLINWVARLEELFVKAASVVINDQIDCGIDIVKEGEVGKENLRSYYTDNFKHYRSSYH